MKTIEEIINREDYVRANEALTRRVRELVPILAKKIYELKQYAWRNKTELPAQGVTVNGHSYCVVAVRTVGRQIDINALSLARVYNTTHFGGGEYFYDHEDLRNSDDYSTNLDFLNDAKAILLMLDETETKLAKDAEKAIENSKHLKLY